MMNKKKAKKNADDDDNGFAEWGGYMEAKKQKLLEQYQMTTVKNAVKLSAIFDGVAIFVNGLTNPNADDLKQLMAMHGGIYHTYQNTKTTHIIASNLPNVKVSCSFCQDGHSLTVAMLQIKQLGGVPIVKPTWITESITFNKLLDYRRYLLYTNQTITQPKLQFPVNDCDSVANNTKTASDPNFLTEFYNNSRLHLISTLGAEFKQLIAEWREKKSDNSFPAREQLQPTTAIETPSVDRCIMHIDMDCFFVSVSLRKRPDLCGKPIAVTHARHANLTHKRDSVNQEMALYESRRPDAGTVDDDQSMSEIACCSYEARAYGVRAGMYLGTAHKLCPDLIPIPYDFEDYRQVAHELYQTIALYTLDIEAVSCDELYVDVTSILNATGVTVMELATRLRQHVREQTGCPCSCGIGPNRLVARLATRRAKPDGQFHVLSQDVATFMYDIKLADLPGVGYATVTKLKRLGVEKCGDVNLDMLATLKQELGARAGECLYEQTQGVDKRPLQYDYARKSVSAEVNYGIRFKQLNEFDRFLLELAGEVWNRLLELRMRARTVTLKLMVRASDAPIETAKYLGHGICDSITRSCTLATFIQDANAIYRAAKQIYTRLNLDFHDLRGIGLQLTKLEKLKSKSMVLNNFLKNHRNTTILPTVTTENLSEKKTNENITVLPTAKTEKLLENKTINNQLELFLNKKTECPTPSSCVDPEVLAALPEDIRNEIIEQYNLMKPIKLDEKKVDVGVDIDGATMFAHLDLEGLRHSIRAWFETEATPSDVDTELLGIHFKNMALKRQIEMLSIIIRFFRRLIINANCIWHATYRQVIDTMQQGMLARYGHLLAVERKFDCC